MKISAPQYAKSLYDSVSGKSEKEIKAIMKSFVALLGNRRELGRAEEIIRAFSDCWDKENSELSAELMSARKLEPAAREMVLGYLEQKAGAKKINLEEKIDGKLLGGFVLKYGSKVLDGSLKAGLEDLKNKISN